MTIRSMSAPAQILKQIDFKDDVHFTHFSQLVYEEVRLRFSKIFIYTDTENLGYEFAVQYGDEDAGTLTAVINNNFEDDVEGGNIGLFVAEHYRGLKIPFKTVKAIAPLFKFHDHDQVAVTFDEGNKALEEVCVKLLAAYAGKVETESGDFKSKYIIDL